MYVFTCECACLCTCVCVTCVRITVFIYVYFKMSDFHLFVNVAAFCVHIVERSAMKNYDVSLGNVSSQLNRKTKNERAKIKIIKLKRKKRKRKKVW